MQLVEQHVIDRNDSRFAAIDAAAFASKNLYNAALYLMRQSFIHEGKRLSYTQMDKLMKLHEAYKALPAKVAQQVLMQLANYAGIDIGMETLAALTSNQPGFVPVLVNGRPMKSTNQYYNKRRAALQSKLGHPDTTKRMERLTNRRNRRIEHYMHTASRWIIDDLVAHGIGTLVIGKNDGWKQEAHMGKRTNQNFVSIPHARFIQMLTYKVELVGIRVILEFVCLRL